MKKVLFISIFFLFVAIALNHGARTLNRVGNNIHASFLRDCDQGTVKIERSFLFGFPISVTVVGRNCAGPDTAYQGYRAEVWDHFFGWSIEI